MIPMSLSPRPEMFTITISDFFIFGARLMHFGYGVGGFERGNNSFRAGEHGRGFERFRVGGGDIFGAALIVQPGVLGADRRDSRVRRRRSG